MKNSHLKELLNDWPAYASEFLGTFLFVFAASLVVITNALYGGIDILGVALSIGLLYTSLIFVTAHLSGGYLNPAVTVALWLVQKLDSLRAGIFLFSQILASFLAAWVLLLLFGQNGVDFALGSPVLGLNITLTQAVVFESIFTAGFVFVLFSTAVDRRGPVSFGALALGLYLTAVTIFLFPISGAALNPVRALGPAVFSGSTSMLAVWLIGPLAGSLFAIVYDLIFLKKKSK